MKNYLLTGVLLLALCACSREKTDAGQQSGPRMVTVSLTVRPERMASVTRSADESAVRDLNFYLCDDNGDIILHRYQTSATLRFESLPGNYLMRSFMLMNTTPCRWRGRAT